MRSSLKIEDTFGGCQVAAAWPGVQPLLRRAASREQGEPASGMDSPIPKCFGPSERVAGRREATLVARPETPQRAAWLQGEGSGERPTR